ncbi:transposase [Proteus vulgaris]
MIRKRCSFSAEFKCEAAARVLGQDYSVVEVCYALDIEETVLRC